MNRFCTKNQSYLESTAIQAGENVDSVVNGER